MIRIKRVYDPREPDDGVRILCTQLWPRGVRSTAVDRWLPELGVPPELRRPWLEGSLDPDRFEARVGELLDTPAAAAAVGAIAELVRANQAVTLMTSVRDMSKTHLTLVKERIEARLRQG